MKLILGGQKKSLLKGEQKNPWNVSQAQILK